MAAKEILFDEKARQAVLDAIESGTPLVIGTHALMQEGVSQRRYELETGVRMDVDDYVEKPVEGKGAFPKNNFSKYVK